MVPGEWVDVEKDLKHYKWRISLRDHYILCGTTARKLNLELWVTLGV